MRVAIKGMLMPVNCQTCPFCMGVDMNRSDQRYCMFTLKNVGGGATLERRKDCPLEEVEGEE